MAIRAEWVRTVAPAVEPITVVDAKKHAVVHQTDDDALLASYIAAMREEAELFLNRALPQQTWKLEVSDWMDEIRLPMAAPLQSVTSVQYYDAAGALQTLATTYYSVDVTAEPGRVLRKPNQVWPALEADRLMRVIITYVCGWSDVADIPESIKHGIRLRVAHADADRLGAADAAASRAAAQALWAPSWRPTGWC